jgi:hypothetical protein
VALSAPAEVTTTAPSSTATARPNPVTDPETPVTSAEVWRLWNVHFKSPVVASATRRNELTEPPSPFSDARETTPSETVSPFIDPAPFDVSAGSPLGVSFGTSTASKVQRPSSVATTGVDVGARRVQRELRGVRTRQEEHRRVAFTDAEPNASVRRRARH